MSTLSKWSEKIGRSFEKGRPLHCFSSLFDAVDTFLLTPSEVTKEGSHVRDAVDMKRIMITVMIALMPALLFGMWNLGYQHYLSVGAETGFWSCFWYGFLKWLPLVIVTYVSGLSIEVAFAQWRGHQVAEGFFVTGFIIPLIMPPDVPLWIVAVATAFSVLFAKEVFGGTGYNFLNPALVARAFVFFAYPSVISGDSVWIAESADAVSGATPLALVMNGSMAQMPSFLDMFVGTIPGCIGETSKIAILLGGAERVGCDDDGDVGGGEDLAGAAYALCAERSLVVEAGGVGKQAWTEGKYLHRLGYRVGGGAGDVAHDGDLLSGEGVDERALAGVAPPEECQSHAVARWRLVQAGHAVTSVGCCSMGWKYSVFRAAAQGRVIGVSGCHRGRGRAYNPNDGAFCLRMRP